MMKRSLFCCWLTDAAVVMGADAVDAAGDGTSGVTFGLAIKSPTGSARVPNLDAEGVGVAVIDGAL